MLHPGYELNALQTHEILECGGLPPLFFAEQAPLIQSGSKLPHSK
jgi:hypothetical protein